MKSLTIKSYINQHAKVAIQPAIERAYGFLCARYGYRFDDVNLIFVPEHIRGRYKPKESIRKGNLRQWREVATAKISTRSFWLSYSRKSIGVTANKLPVGYEIGTALVIIHELTHHIQAIEHRKFSEVETTQNEMDFITQVDPQWNKFLTTL